MKLTKNRSFLHILTGVLVVNVSLFLYSCANMARPGGGPKDEEPPVFVKSNPVPDQVNILPKKIVIEFDENVKLDKPGEKVVVSPPQVNMPIISSNAHKVTVELKDTLLPNTTYTIEFGDAIQDNNEGNPIPDFALSFATGAHIDTLQFSGTLLNAENLEPVTGSYVGIQSDLADSAFYNKPFVRIAKTNEKGKFTLRNVAPGSYRVYALKDVNSNYRFDIPTEDIAFLDSIVTPAMEIKIHRDTIWKDSVTVDSIVVHEVPHFYPDDLVLLSFNENKKNVYLEKAERPAKNKVTFYFSAPEDSLPQIKGLNFDETDWALAESSAQNDTVSFWIRDSLIYKMDTLQLLAGYYHTDTLNNLSLTTDTLSLFMRQPKKQAPRKEVKKKETSDTLQVEKIAFLPVRDEVSTEIGVKPRFIFDEPIESFNPEGIRLELKQDSVYILQPSQLIRTGSGLREYTLNGRYVPGNEYLITIDSASVTGLYGLHNEAYSKSFKVKNAEEYAQLVVSLTGVRDSAYVELLDKNDTPVAKSPVKEGKAKFTHVKPGTYFARIVLDKNGNSKFDTGNYNEKRQPEEVRYYPGSMELRANWRVEQEWDIYARPLINQKPLEITKNKPKEEKKDEQNQQNTQQNTQQNMQYGGGSISGQTNNLFSPNTRR